MNPLIRISFAAFLLVLPLRLLAEEAIGKVVFVKGKAMVVRLSDPQPKPLQFNDQIYQMDTLQTDDGELKVLFDDQTVLSLKPKSKVLITEHVYRPNQGTRRSIFDILKGNVRTIIERTASLRNDDVRLQTPTAVAGIRGTDVGTRVLGSLTYFLCFDGSIETWLKQDPSKTLTLGAGEMTKIKDAPPTEKEKIPPGMEKQFVSGGGSIKEITEQKGGTALQPAQTGDAPAGTTTSGPPPSPEPPKTESGAVGTTTTEQPPILPGATSETPPDATGTSGGTGGGTGGTGGGTGGTGGGTGGGSGGTGGTGGTGGGTGGTGGSTGGGGTPSSPVNVPVTFPNAGLKR